MLTDIQTDTQTDTDEYSIVAVDKPRLQQEFVQGKNVVNTEDTVD